MLLGDMSGGGLVRHRAPAPDGGAPLSCRATELLGQRRGTPGYLIEHVARLESSVLTPGLDLSTVPPSEQLHIPLAIAENKLAFSILLRRFPFAKLLADSPLGSHEVGYDDPRGSGRVRVLMAELMSRNRPSMPPIDPEHLCLAAGCSAIMDLLMNAICDEGEGCLIPAPYFPGFDANLGDRACVQVVPVHAPAVEQSLMGHVGGVAGGDVCIDAGIAPEALEVAYGAASVPVRAMLLTHPHNPSGLLYSDKALQEAMAWAARRGLHVVVDEVYANCVMEGGADFWSAACIAPPELPPSSLHIMYGLSKDFGLAGARVGVLHTLNANVRSAVASLTHFCEVSRPLQAILQRILSDRPGVDAFLAEMNVTLAAACRSTVSQLHALGIPCLQPRAGVFLLLDLRRWLPVTDQTFAAENRLWHHILAHANINLTPGGALHFCTPGFMRLCFAYCEPEVVSVAITRLASALVQI